MPASSLSRRLAQFAHELRLNDVPRAVQRQARLHLVDALGVGLGASSTPGQQRFLAELAQADAANGMCTVLGRPTAVPAPTAALLNGSSIHSLEYDDTHMASIVHGSAVIVPAALAAAEQHGLSLDELVRLVVAGWETLVRIGEAAPGAFQRRGFQVTSVGGVIVTALLGAVAAGADADRTVAAMGIAGSQAGGLFEFLSNGSTVKALHPGWAAHAGLWAAACARAGMTGPETVLEGRYGLFAAYADDRAAGERLSQALAGLGRDWKLAEAAFKLYPCCHYIHPYLECAERLKVEMRGAQAIETVRFRVAAGAADVICLPWSSKTDVKSGVQAKHSLPYCVARVLLGRPVDIDSITTPTVDAEAVQLAQRFRWEPWPGSGFPARFDADMEIVLADGRRLTAAVEQVQGSAERPVRDEEIQAKFRRNAQRTLPALAADAVWQAVMAEGTLASLQSALRSAAC
jgi:2-methylcitrate dehydratase PrpD